MPKVRPLTRMTFSSIRAVLVDLSGTIHIDDSEVPGSIQALSRLGDTNVHVKFVTNTTKESKSVLLNRLNKIGFNISPDQVFTSLTAARRLIDTRKLSPLMLIDEKAQGDFQGVPQDEYDSVLVGLAPNEFHYENMNRAFRLLADGAPLIAIHKARYYKRSDGLALGPGPFVAALEYSAGTTADVVGKPERSFFLSAIEEFNIRPEECVMIGDDARDDVGGSIRAGMQGILVKTGKYRPGDDDYLPTGAVTADSFSDAVNIIIDALNTKTT